MQRLDYLLMIQVYMLLFKPKSAALCLNSDLNKILNWAKLRLVSFNYYKNESIIISRKVNKPYYPSIYMEITEKKEVSAHVHLGIFFSNETY